MNGLSNELRRRIGTLRPDWDAGAVSGFIYLEGGYSNDNYRFEYGGERFVLRAPTRPRAFVDRRLEQSLYALGADAGMPELMAFDAESGCMISRWVPGALLADRRPDGLALVRYLKRLHAQLPPVERIYDPLAQARAYLEQAAAPQWVEALAARLEWSPETLTTCHNDLNPWNVVCAADDRWITLDWEWVGRNDPLFDLVTLHQGANLPEEELPKLGEWLWGSAPAAGHVIRCLTVFWLRETSWAIAEIASGNDRREVAEQRHLGLVRLRALTGRARG